MRVHRGVISHSPRCLCVTKMAVGLSVDLRNYFDTCGVFFFGGAWGLGAAKDGSDLAQDIAVDVLGAAKNGSVKVPIVKVFILSIVKARAGHVASFPQLSLVARCPETQSAYKPIRTLAPQTAPRVEPEFPLSLWIRVRRSMLARMVTVSGHRGPVALKPLRPSSRQAPF